MTSSRFGILKGELDKDHKFSNDTRKHEIDGKSVKGHINFFKKNVYHGIEIIPGTVIDWKNTKSKKVTFDKDMPQLTTNYNLQPHQIDFFILNC